MAALYTPDAQRVLEKLGDLKIRRASFIEPGDLLRSEALAWLLCRGKIPQPLKWYADLLDTLGEVQGPFDTRDEAVNAELTALDQKPSALFNAE